MTTQKNNGRSTFKFSDNELIRLVGHYLNHYEDFLEHFNKDKEYIDNFLKKFKKIKNLQFFMNLSTKSEINNL